jgi:hypothetical protein
LLRNFNLNETVANRYGTRKWNMAR